MTNRERVIRTLGCQPTDRPPFVWWLGFAPWGETHERWKQESGIADLDLVNYFGFEPFHQVVNVDYGPFPAFEPKVLSEDSQFVISLDSRGIVRRDRKDMGSMPEWLAHPIRSRADWETYKAERLEGGIEARTAKLEEQLPRFAEVDAHRQVGGFPWGVYGTARDLMGAEELLLAFYDDPDLVRDIMDTCVSLWLALYESIQARVQIDHIHIWEDMAGKQGSLISPAMVEEFMMPHYDRIAAFARQHQVPALSVDSDGRIDQLVSVMARHGVNAFLPFEVQAGCEIERTREQYPQLGLLGGLDKNALAKGRPEMHRELDRAQRLLARGGYVAGLDHLIPPNVPWANYKYFVEEIRKIIGL